MSPKNITGEVHTGDVASRRMKSWCPPRRRPCLVLPPLPDLCCLLWLGSQEFLLEVGGGLVRSCSPPEPAPPDPDLQQHLQGRGAQLNSYQEFGTLLNVKWFSEGLER